MTVHHPDKAGRQLVGARHRGPVDQDRNDADIALQGRLNLQADEVVGIFQATLPIMIGDREPTLTDQRQQHVAGPDRVGDHLGKLVAQLERVDILEDLLAAEVLDEPGIEPAPDRRSLPAGS
jgi:hypothetical protein